MNKRNLYREISTSELVGVILVGAVIIVPLILLLALPENTVVQVVLGGRRLLLIWLGLGVIIWLNSGRFDRLIDRQVKRLQRK